MKWYFHIFPWNDSFIKYRTWNDSFIKNLWKISFHVLNSLKSLINRQSHLLFPHPLPTCKMWNSTISQCPAWDDALKCYYLAGAYWDVGTLARINEMSFMRTITDWVNKSLIKVHIYQSTSFLIYFRDFSVRR